MSLYLLSQLFTACYVLRCITVNAGDLPDGVRQETRGLTKYKEELISSSGDDAVWKEIPTLLGSVHYGFLPDTTSMLQSLDSLMLEHREELKPGEKTRASVIGSMNAHGHFWVRPLLDDSRSQEIMLLNLSNAMR